jgi:hypothetical protein
MKISVVAVDQLSPSEKCPIPTPRVSRNGLRQAEPRKWGLAGRGTEQVNARIRRFGVPQTHDTKEPRSAVTSIGSSPRNAGRNSSWRAVPGSGPGALLPPFLGHSRNQSRRQIRAHMSFVHLRKTRAARIPREGMAINSGISQRASSCLPFVSHERVTTVERTCTVQA